MGRWIAQQKPANRTLNPKALCLFNKAYYLLINVCKFES